MAAELGHIVGTLLSLSAAADVRAYRKRRAEASLDRRALLLRPMPGVVCVWTNA